jgi:hypothetical protein
MAKKYFIQVKSGGKWITVSKHNDIHDALFVWDKYPDKRESRLKENRMILLSNKGLMKIEKVI